jgi:hypothetical protein
MRKQILALLSALGLAGSAAGQTGGGAGAGKVEKADHTIQAESTVKSGKAAKERQALNWKWSKNRAESNALKTSKAHKQEQASRKRQNTLTASDANLKAGKVNKPRKTSSTANKADWSWGSGKTSAGKKHQLGASDPADARVTLNPQPLPPGVHTDVGGKGLSAGKNLTLNPQPLPPGAHGLNPQPLPPGVHPSTGPTLTVNPQPSPAAVQPSGKTGVDQKPHGPQRE